MNRRAYSGLTRKVRYCPAQVAGQGNYDVEARPTAPVGLPGGYGHVKLIKVIGGQRVGGADGIEVMRLHATTLIETILAFLWIPGIVVTYWSLPEFSK